MWLGFCSHKALVDRNGCHLGPGLTHARLLALAQARCPVSDQGWTLRPLLHWAQRRCSRPVAYDAPSTPGLFASRHLQKWPEAHGVSQALCPADLPPS